MDCYLFWTILATNFPTKSRSAMPGQLSQQCEFLSLGIGKRMASAHSCGTHPSSHTALIMSVSMPINSSPQAPALSISGKLLEKPTAFPFFSFSNALFTSLAVDLPAMLPFTSLCHTDTGDLIPGSAGHTLLSILSNNFFDV